MSIESTETTVELEDQVLPDTQTSEEQAPLVVGANSVYKDVQSLIEGKRQADAFIEKLKAENQALFEQLKAQTNLNKFKEELQQMTEITEATAIGATTQLTEDQIRDIALKSFEAKQAEMQRTSSLQKANDALQAMYGSEASIKKENKAKELGMTVEQLDEMCVNAPKAFNKLMGIEDPQRVTFNSIQSTMQVVDRTQSNVDERVAKLTTDPTYIQSNPQAVASLVEDALKNPSILSSITTWKTLVK